MSDALKVAIAGLVGLVLVIAACLFYTAHDEVKLEIIKQGPVMVTALLAGTAAVLTAYGLYQNRLQSQALARGHQQLAQAVRDEAGKIDSTVRDEAGKVDSTVRDVGVKVAIVTTKKAQQTQDKVEEVHKLVNGGPDGLSSQLKGIMAELLQEVLAQATERVANSTERGQAKGARENMTGKKETDQAIPTAAHTQLVEDLEKIKAKGEEQK